MTGFFRITAYVLLASLVLSLSDWPYVDEILDDLPLQPAQAALAHALPEGEGGQSRSPAPPLKAKLCCAYGDLANLAVLSPPVGQAVTGLSHDFPAEPFSRPGAVPPERIYRPPPPLACWS